jgi:hypothetical protein
LLGRISEVADGTGGAPAAGCRCQDYRSTH